MSATGSVTSTRSITHSQGGHSIEVYRGYFIRPVASSEGVRFQIERDGRILTWGLTSADAHRHIDETALYEALR